MTRRAARLAANLGLAAGEHGARFLGVLGVSKTQLEPEVLAATLLSLGCRAEAHDVDLLPARLRRAVEARELPVLDLLPAFRAHAAAQHLHFRLDGHWSAAGHRVAAEALYADLLQRGILNPGQPPR